MKQNRIFEIDLLRVMAILLMIIYHLVFDLREFAHININYDAPLWFFIGKASAFIFILVSGISCGLSHNPIKHGVKVFFYGMIITIVTYFFDREEYIRFGILHFLGVSMMIFPLLNKMKKWQLLLLSIICIIIGRIAVLTTVKTFLILPLGFMYNNFSTMDYYPIFPYLAIFMLGVVVYKAYYYKRESIFKSYYENSVINFISRNSLRIYLIHQPIFLATIFLITYIMK